MTDGSITVTGASTKDSDSDTERSTTAYARKTRKRLQKANLTFPSIDTSDPSTRADWKKRTLTIAALDSLLQSSHVTKLSQPLWELSHVAYGELRKGSRRLRFHVPPS